MPSVERMRPLLGTFVTIRAQGAVDASEAAVAAAVESAFVAISRVDRLMSFHRRGSDIGRLNRARPGTRLRVHRWTYQVLREAQRLRLESGGAFNCNVGTPLMRAGLLPKLVRGQPVRRRHALPDIHLDQYRWIRLSARVVFDLGGIAKGFAVDKAVETLQRGGIASGLVNAGGDMRVFGVEPQPVWARCPSDPANVRMIGMLTNGAIATSAAYFVDRNPSGGAAASAIVKATTGRRVRMASSVSVVARSGMLADALTKVAVIKQRLPSRLARYARARMVTI
ncbi:MAG: FAD:protein FMN transferase [Gammaproteobacteria bacterium]|nr:FAD:protein FMN transferase [Gammaproteobacteria bacterium]